jgi:HAD superfamily hydrolase (TIGR01509 family)
MLSLVVFDMDGVLIDCKHIHAKSFISSWNISNPSHQIDEIFHHKYLDGRNTYAKIDYLQNYFKTSVNTLEIFNNKQFQTYTALELFEYSNTISEVFEQLQKDGYIIACASNSIRKTVDLILNKLNIAKYFDLILSNEDVMNPKPNPEIYQKVMTTLGYQPSNTYIFEDSEIGLTAAKASGANVIQIHDSKDLNYKFITKSLKYKMRYTPWIDNPDWKLRIVIPMAGEGSRFKQAGYTISKPLIPIQDKPMIMWVLDNLRSKNPEVQKRIEYHLIVRSQAMDELKDLSGVVLHPIQSLTDGAACTVLTIREELLKDNNPLLMANSDQYLEWDFDAFLEMCVNPGYDGCISTFYNPDSNDTKWSFAQVDKNGLVTKVAEKEYIGPNATTGLYYWQDGSKFVQYADEMIEKNERVKNEFYVCPVYNYLMRDGGKIRVSDCKKMWGLGIPEDLDYFKKHYLHLESN